jgi:hypothetical protein
MPLTEHKDPYFVPREAFEDSSSIVPLTYRFGERITRGNFASFLVDSFTKSRGVVNAQWAYLEYLRLNEGFQYAPTFKHYKEAGGSKCLSSEETQLILGAFKRIGRHSDYLEPLYKHPLTDHEIVEQVDSGVDEFVEPQYLPRLPIAQDKLRNIPKDEFLHELNFQINKIPHMTSPQNGEDAA